MLQITPGHYPSLPLTGGGRRWGVTLSVIPAQAGIHSVHTPSFQFSAFSEMVPDSIQDLIFFSVISSNDSERARNRTSPADCKKAYPGLLGNISN